MGGHEQDQEHVAESARPPLDAAGAREMTAGLREAMADVRRTVAVLVARVRVAHAARVWVPLGYGSWEAYCDAEFGISVLRRTGSWMSPAPWPRSTTRSPPAPTCLSCETPGRPPRPRSTTACPSGP